MYYLKLASASHTLQVLQNSLSRRADEALRWYPEGLQPFAAFGTNRFVGHCALLFVFRQNDCPSMRLGFPMTAATQRCNSPQLLPSTLADEGFDTGPMPRYLRGSYSVPELSPEEKLAGLRRLSIEESFSLSAMYLVICVRCALTSPAAGQE